MYCMRHAFYDSSEYRKKQARITKRNITKGVYDHLKKQKKRKCLRPKCFNSFSVQPADPKKYCSNSCAAQVNNAKRGPMDEKTKKKIAASLCDRPCFIIKDGVRMPRKGTQLVPRVEKVCKEAHCQNKFLVEPWRTVSFCGRKCQMKFVGGRPTSPKASRGKAGIRPDISPTIYFYSRWEANIARLYNYLDVKWKFAPKSFDIGGQMYTPDFFLLKTDTYVEVKNFWGTYSKQRDTKFRKAYPDIALEVILKDEYLKLEKCYAHHIPSWEYKNSVFPAVSA